MKLTRFLYQFGEVKHSLIYSVLKKTSFNECLFWTSEFYYSGYFLELWKLIWKIYYDFYAIIHPKLADITPYISGRNDLVNGRFLGGYMEIKSKSITSDGNLCAPRIGTLSNKNLSRVYYYSLFPNMLLSLHPDYIMFHIIYPMGTEECKIDCTWLFSKDAVFLTAGACARKWKDILTIS